MSENVTITWAGIHYGDPVVRVEGYRTNDHWGDEVLVLSFWYNGGQIQSDGAKIRKDGNPAARQTAVWVEVPANVRAALKALKA